jgi:hypothetical protein
MDEWQALFGQVQGIVRAGASLQTALEQVTKFALDNPGIFDEPDYWRGGQAHAFGPAFDTLVGWAKQGLESLEPKSGWEFMLLDLGDCPETFRLYSPGGQAQMSQQKMKALLSTELIVGPSDLERCFSSDVADPFAELFGPARVERTEHHVSELGDKFLNWTTGSEDADFHGNNGYLLWLVLGSLALTVPLQNEAYRKGILKGRESLYLLSGFEEIFCPLVTLTAGGMSYE